MDFQLLITKFLQLLHEDDINPTTVNVKLSKNDFERINLQLYLRTNNYTSFSIVNHTLSPKITLNFRNTSVVIETDANEKITTIKSQIKLLQKELDELQEIK